MVSINSISKTIVLRNGNTSFIWCLPRSIGHGLKYILQPESVNEGANNEYEAFAISYNDKPWYLWYKPIRKANDSIQYYLNSKKPLGNLCLFDSSSNNGPAYWSETRGTLYFYPNTDNIIDGLESGEGINLVDVEENVGENLAQNIPTWLSPHR